MKILFLPMDGHGHVNSCIGLARMFRDYGHECVFVVPSNWTVLLKGHSFKVETFIDPKNNDSKQDPLDRWAGMMRNLSPSFAKTPSEQIVDLLSGDMREFIEFVERIDDQITLIIEKVNPDLIVVDFYVTVPAVVKSGKLWVLSYSANPLFVYNTPEAPPRFSGLGANDDPKLFKKFRDLFASQLKPVKVDFDSYLMSKGLTPHPTELVTISPFLNIYSYPEDLDYSELGPIPDKWSRLDHMVREADDSAIGFDESFFQTDDKIIFFSLGSMGSADVTLMKRLIGFMSETKHRYIITKGPYHDEIILTDNMIGGKYLNQIKILPKVDLVITHGGNNTFIEALYFGKPMIVLPLFNDQHDNAQRAIDKKIGKSFRPHHVGKEEFINAIDDILNDKELIDRVKAISDKIRNTKSHKQLNDNLISLVNDFEKDKIIN